MKTKTIRVSDKMQKGYRYELTEPVGKNFAPEFKPELTPKEMLELGVFGGVYLRDCTKEFPKNWFAKAKFQKKGSYVHEAKLNFFGINASQPLSVWREKGWIFEKHDPRGWFQWYCRYYMGRRIPDMDNTQIKRWKAIKRHIAQIKKNCRTKDNSCRQRQRQAVLHWAYDSQKI
ncbi:MAG TPA: hypothetical protein P5274_00950 [Candidatus Paceibacterota bacterium]|nr:hypothetical protein [Candidatus Paceibacterota bacterium]